MRSKNGCLRSLEVTVRLIKSADEHRPTVPQVEYDGYGTVVGHFNNASPHAWVFIKVELSICQFTPVEQIFQ